jgi:hypothetical protein
MIPRYTTAEQIENYLLITIDEAFKTQVNEWILAMEEYIDKYTGRSFVSDESASDRYFDGNCSKVLYIDECVEITEIEVDGQILASSDYVTMPYNKKPIRSIKFKDSVFQLWTKGEKNVRISAKWGYSENVPAPIKFVATVLASGVVNYSKNTSGKVQSEKVGDYQITYKLENKTDYDKAIEILDTYTKIDV